MITKNNKVRVIYDCWENKCYLEKMNLRSMEVSMREIDDICTKEVYVDNPINYGEKNLYEGDNYENVKEKCYYIRSELHKTERYEFYTRIDDIDCNDIEQIESYFLEEMQIYANPWTQLPL